MNAQDVPKRYRAAFSPRMKAGEGRVDHPRPLPGDVQQQEAAVGAEPVHAQGVPRRVAPRAVGELLEVGVTRNKEELLVDELLVDGADVRILREAPIGGGVAVAGGVGGEDGGHLVLEDGAAVGGHVCLCCNDGMQKLEEMVLR